MTGVDLDAVRELRQPAKRTEQALGALARGHGQIGSRSVADEQRVAREDEPRLVSPRPVGDREAAVLRPMAGRVNRAEAHRADLDDRTLIERLVYELGFRRAVDVHRAAVIECESP